MKNVTQRQFINVLLTISLLLLSGSIILAYKQVQQLKIGNGWIVHTYQVLSQSDKTQLSLTEAELLVHDNLDLKDGKSAFLFKIKINDAMTNLEKLTQLTADNTSQQRNIGRLRPLLERKIHLLQEALINPVLYDSITQRMTFRQALRDVNTKIEEAISDIQEVELLLLGVRESQYQYNSDKTNLMLLIAGVLGNGLLLFTFVLLNHYLRQRNIAESEKEKSESNLKRIIDSSHDLIAAIDPNYRFTAFNNAYERKFRQLFNKEIKIGMSLQDAFAHAPEAQIIINTWQRALSGEVFTVIHRFDDENHSENESHYYETTYNSVYDNDNRLIGACHIMRDVTERRKAEQLKNEFISVVSHELRTPLTSIRGSLGLLIGGALGNLDDKTRSMLNIAYNNCERLVNLINDILDIEKIESGKSEFHFAAIDMNKIVDESVNANLALAQKSAVKLVVKKPNQNLFVQADHDRIIQVLSHLIVNAIKFSKENSEVIVQVAAIEKNVRVSVIDHRQEISEVFQQHGFEKYSQTESFAMQNQAGSGLGLNISRAVIERHNGDMGFVATPTEGTIFYFELPLWEEIGNSSMI